MDADHVGDEFGVVAEIGVHDDDEVPGRELQTVDVGSAETEFAGACAELDSAGGVGFLELEGDFLGSVGGAVVHDYEFPVEIAVRKFVRNALEKWAVGMVVGNTYFSVKVLFSSHVIMGRLRRSL